MQNKICLFFLLTILVFTFACSSQMVAIPRPSVTPQRTPIHAAIQTPSWFRDVTLYEIFPRSFSDSNGDGIGDLPGITQKLDYLQRLGVGALWLTPIFASPSEHGYDTTDYYKINPAFGTEADLIELVRAAHERHIRVLLDYVVAHTSSKHPFFKDAFANPKSKYADWYVWNNPGHTQYEAYSGVQEMPHLNHDNPEVQKYLLDVAKYWIQKANIDGYRCDYALGVPHAFWKKLRAEIKPLNPDFLLLGEVYDYAMSTIAPYYDNEFDATFDFPIYRDIEGSETGVNDNLLLGIKDPQLLDGSLVAEQVLFPSGAQRVIFISNHDTNRVMSKVNDDVQRAKLGALLLLTQSGTPMIYYGEEIGMRGVKSSVPDYDKTRREPMDWYGAEMGAGMTTWYKPATRNNQPNDGVSVQEERINPDSLLEYYRRLIALRNANSALRTGTREQIATNGTSLVYAYLRRDENSAFVIVLNFGSQPASVQLDLRPSSLPDGQYKAIDIFTKREIALEDLTFKLNLDAASGTIVQLVSR